MKHNVDFGLVASDYERYRPSFPDSLYKIQAGQCALDLGTGTGTLAIGLAKRQLSVLGLDPSRELLRKALLRSQEEVKYGDIDFREGTAEDTGIQNGGVYDVVCAGQCWWWFDADKALKEIRRVAKPGGRLLIPCFSYIVTPASVASRTEELVLQYNPDWNMAGTCGMFPDIIRDLDRGGVKDVKSFSYVENISFSHEGWRGRIRACNGVGPSMDEEVVENFDKHIKVVLEEEFPETLSVPHRVFVVSGTL